MAYTAIAFAGIFSCTQAAVQIIMSSLSLAQYFCIIDFLQELPGLLYIKILYYHNPNLCGQRVNIGQAIASINNQAFVLITKEPFTVTRTFYINCVSLGLGILWFLASVILMTSRRNSRMPIRWPWVVVTIGVCALDVVAAVIFTNDTFFTRSLTDIMQYIEATASGLGNAELDTKIAAWTMVALHGRLGVFFLINIILLIVVTLKKEKEVTVADNVSEAPSTTKLFVRRETPHQEDSTSSSGTSYELEVNPIPRPTLTRKTDPEMDKTVKFIANVIATPCSKERMENIIEERQSGLNISVISTTSQNQQTPHSSQDYKTSVTLKPGSAELQRQLPWSYLPSTSQPMRSQLPPDEDLPPVPLPDYTVVLNPRKASVHRSPSNLGSTSHPRTKLHTAIFRNWAQSRPSRVDDVLPKVFLYYSTIKTFLSSRWIKNPRLSKIRY